MRPTRKKGPRVLRLRLTSCFVADCFSTGQISALGATVCLSAGAAVTVTHRNPECLEFHHRAPTSGLALVPAEAGTTDGPTNLDRSTHHPSILSAVTPVPSALSFAHASLPPLGAYCGRIPSATLLVPTRVDAHSGHRCLHTRRRARPYKRPPPPTPYLVLL